MPNKTRRRARRSNRASVQQLTQKLQQVSVRPKRKKATPFADAGAITGQRLGSMFGMPMLKGVGRWLGSGIGTILGSGDYSVVGAAPAYNVLSNGNQIPKFASTKQTNIVCHREYLGDIFGTAGFNNTSYPLNPGMAVTFPWLSSIAQNYQQYKFHGIIFEFRPLITDFVTNGAPGVVIMATNYNADVPIYTTKQEMENSEYAVSVKPTRDLMHGVECATTQTVLSELYIRSGEVTAGQDLRLYDLGNFQFATQANPVQDLGELWVSYCVEFFKPVLPTDVGGNILSAGTNRSSVTLANPFGSAVSGFFGTLDLVVTVDTLTWTGQPGNHYVVVITYSGATATITGFTKTLTGLTVTNTANLLSPQVNTASNAHTSTSTYVCSLLNPGLVTFKLGPVNGSIPPLVTVLVSEISASIN
jgi:hypothetical protein